MPTQTDQTSFLDGTNATFIAELYARYLENPGSVDASWATFFAEMADDARAVLGELKGASWSRERTQVIGNGAEAPAANGAKGAAAKTSTASGAIDGDAMRAAGTDSIQAVTLIRAYRTRGHLAANLDPLGLEPPKYQPELQPDYYGFTEADLDRPIFLANRLGREGRDPARDHRPAARDLLRLGRHRVHAYPGSRPAPVAAGAHGGRAQPDRVHQGRQAGDLREIGRRRGASSISSTRNTPAPSGSASTAANR